MAEPTLLVGGVEELGVFAAASADVFYRLRVVPSLAFEFIAPGVTALTGYTPEEHYADAGLVLRLLHPDDREKFDLVRDSSNGPLEMRWIRKDGTTVWVEHVNRALRDSDGRLVAVHGLVRDVTERHRVDEEQRVLAQLGKVLTRTLDRDRMLRDLAGILLQDIADLCIVDLVDGRSVIHAAIAHRDPDVVAAVSSFVPNLEHPYLVGEVVAFGRSVFVPDLAELERQHPGYVRAVANISPVSYIGIPLHVRGRLLGILNLVSTDQARRYDVRHLSLAEEVGRRASMALDNAELFEQAQKAVRARDQVLSVVAHDLRNPIGTIALAAGMLASAAPGKTQRLAQMIQRSVKRADQLIGDLLDEQRLERGRLNVNVDAVWPDVIVLDALDAIQTIADHAGIRLTARIDDHLPRVSADLERIARVFSNLIGNAIKFTPRGGAIEVRATREGDTVRFAVSDTGPGIDAEHVARLFEPYWQRDPTDERGLGLGLTIANQIIIAHGSTLSVESREGHGTSFSFALGTLPTAHDAVASGRHADDARSQLTGDPNTTRGHD